MHTALRNKIDDLRMSGACGQAGCQGRYEERETQLSDFDGEDESQLRHDVPETSESEEDNIFKPTSSAITEVGSSSAITEVGSSSAIVDAGTAAAEDDDIEDLTEKVSLPRGRALPGMNTQARGELVALLMPLAIDVNQQPIAQGNMFKRGIKTVCLKALHAPLGPPTTINELEPGEHLSDLFHSEPCPRHALVPNPV